MNQPSAFNLQTVLSHYRLLLPSVALTVCPPLHIPQYTVCIWTVLKSLHTLLTLHLRLCIDLNLFACRVVFTASPSLSASYLHEGLRNNFIFLLSCIIPSTALIALHFSFKATRDLIFICNSLALAYIRLPLRLV